MNYDEEAPFEIAQYREMQKALPGVEALYSLMLAQIEIALPAGGQVLVVGAGGGREVEALLASEIPFDVVGVDPSNDMLDIARWYSQQSERPEKAKLIQGLTKDVPRPDGGFDAATSVLVMHFLPDDDSEGGKLAYLKSIRERLKPDGLIIHADVSFETNHADIAPVFLRHARLAGLPEETMSAAPKAISTMPIIGTSRLADLYKSAGFSLPELFFQTLWYRAWYARAV
ncbi:MAG: class I SAM-dependent methyltransferase [Pseudomonadota bacterium]